MMEVLSAVLQPLTSDLVYELSCHETETRKKQTKKPIQLAIKHTHTVHTCTVEPPQYGHGGDNNFHLYREVVS